MLRYGNSVDLTKSFPPHPSEDILEEYVFGRLPEALTAQVLARGLAGTVEFAGAAAPEAVAHWLYCARSFVMTSA